MALMYAPGAVAGRCDIALCEEFAIGEDTFCETCHRALCRLHHDSEEHSCRYSQLDVFQAINNRYALQDDLDEKAVVRRLEDLRPGHQCSIIISSDFYAIDLHLIGAFNIHLVARFDDDLEWLIRLTGYPMGPVPPETRIRMLNSEVVTYQVLDEARVPIAKLHDWGYGLFSKTNNSYCVHLIYDRMPGLPGFSPQSLLGMTETDDRKMRLFVDQYVAASIEISILEFEAIGSLDRDVTGNVIVGLSAEFPWYDTAGQALFGGPFLHLRDHYLFTIDNTLEAIRHGRMHRAGPLLPYLIYLDLRRMVSSNPILAREETTFYLRHPDLTPANILCTSERITAIVDWEGTYTTTKAAAFSLPRWAELIYHGDRSKAEIMLCDAYTRAGRSDLADCVRDGRLYIAIDDILHNPMPCDRPANLLLAQLNDLTIAFDSAEDQGREPPESLGEWGRWALRRYHDDSHLSQVIELDRLLLKIRRPAVEGDGETSIYKRPEQYHLDYFVQPSDTHSRASS